MLTDHTCTTGRQSFSEFQVENEDLVATLETVVERFGEDMAPYAVGLTQHLAAAFWRMQVSCKWCYISSDRLLIGAR